MPFNGSGIFTRIRNWQQDAAAGIAIRADRHDGEDDNFASGLTQCITKDGQTTITANLPMAGYKHTNVAAGSSATDYARLDQVQDGNINWVAAGGTANAITATYNPTTGTPVDGQLYYVRAGAANSTTTPTFSPDGNTARTITKNGNEALVVGDIAGAGHELILRYRLSDTKYELLNPKGISLSSILGANNVFTGTNEFSTMIKAYDIQATNASYGVLFKNSAGNSVAQAGPFGTTDFYALGVFRVPNGISLLTASNTARATLRMPHGTAPTTPENGDFWTTTSGAFVHVNGTTYNFANPTPSRFVSSPQTITLSTEIALAHSLGSTPFNSGMYLICNTAEHGYSVSDRASAIMVESNSASNNGFTVYHNATNVGLVLSAGLMVISQTTNTHVQITPSNWTVVLWAVP